MRRAFDAVAVVAALFAGPLHAQTGDPRLTIAEVEKVTGLNGWVDWGGGAINDFAFCFLVGIITGTYSSIFIASPIVLIWNRAKKIEVGVKPKPAEGPATA